MRQVRSVRHPRSALLVIGAALCALLLTACASSTPNAPSTTSASAAGSTAAGSTAAGTSAAGTTAAGTDGTSTGAAGPSTAADGKTVLTGTIEAGVESGCVVLRGQDGAVLANLIDVDSIATPVGSIVTVTGSFEEDMMTTCQQGKPFTITTIEVG